MAADFGLAPLYPGKDNQDLNENKHVRKGSNHSEHDKAECVF